MVQSTTLTVRSGDTLSALAEQHGVDAEALMRANGMDPAKADGHVSRERADPDRLIPGQQLQIPSATPGYEGTHAVRRGDTLSAIAERWNVSLPDLLAANPQGAGLQPAATDAGRIDLKVFLDPSQGSRALAAIVIGNAEGTRTPKGGTTAAFAGHIDPGNAVRNQGSFSYQSSAASPAEADRLQLQRLQGRVPAFEKAAYAAGLDPNNARLASSYFDLYNQSPAAAGRFLQQMPRLSGAALTPERLTQARVDAFVDPDTGRRFTSASGNPVGGGFATIAQDRLGRRATEAEVQQTIRADQQRRTDAMETALQAQGLLK